jgi:hypothetical protein
MLAEDSQNFAKKVPKITRWGRHRHPPRGYSSPRLGTCPLGTPRRMGKEPSPMTTTEENKALFRRTYEEPLNGGTSPSQTSSSLPTS